MSLTDQKVMQILVQWRTRISASAWVIVRNTHTAEDIYQNVVVKAMTREILFESEAGVLSWAIVTARHEGIDWVHRNRRSQSLFDRDLMLLFDAVLVREANRPEGARLEALQHCLEKVSEESRVMLNLRYADNLGCETIASQMHLSLVAVYKRLSRLHGVLRDCVERRLGSNLDGGIAE